MLFTYLDSIHQGSKIFFIISISYLQVMVLRKRAKLSELSPDAGLSGKTGTEERCSRNLMWCVKSSQGPSEVDTGETSTRRRSNTCSNSEIPPSWPWQHCVSIVAGLLLAGLLALTQAWCVNSLHENLLWFSELTVRAIWDWLPVWDIACLRNCILHYSPKWRFFPCSKHIFAQLLKLRKFRLVFAFHMEDKQCVYSLNKCGGLGLCVWRSSFLPQSLNGKATREGKSGIGWRDKKSSFAICW